MEETLSTPNSAEQVFIDFHRELDEAADDDKAGVVGRYAERYPHLAGDFAAAVSMIGLLGPPPAPRAAESPRPERLGDFRIVAELTQGGMGKIYEAIQEPLRRRVAVKTILREEPAPALRARFLREQQVLAALHHTHIVPILASGQDGTLHYFAMPFIEGAALHHVVRTASLRGRGSPGSEMPTLGELAEEISSARPAPTEARAPAVPERRGPAPQGRPEPTALSPAYFRSVASVVADAAEALHHAHEARVVHRDVKPSNIMVDRHGYCWLIDFGLAGGRPGTDGDAMAPAIPGADGGIEPFTDGAVKGTPEYMAPEQHEGRADARTDVWGLGATLYELLALRRAFDRPRDLDPAAALAKIRDRVVNVPRDLEAVCRKAMQGDPMHRYQTARELGEDLRRWLRDEPIRARPSWALRRAWLWTKRNPGWAAALAVLALALLGFASAGVALAESARSQGEAAEARAETDRHRAREAEARRSAAETKEEIARVRANDAEGRAQGRLREARMQQHLRRRLTDHANGWSEKVWSLIREVAEIGAGDRGELQGHAVASLAGLDASTSKRFDDFGASSLAFDRDGQRLLMGMVAEAKDARKLLGAKLWRLGAEDLADLGVAEYGPVAFRGDGTPVQLVIAGEEEGHETLRLMDLARKEAIHQFEVPGRIDLRLVPELGLAPDGSLVAAPVRREGGPPELAVWSGETGRRLHLLSIRASCCAFSPDRSLVAAGDDSGRVVVWSLATGREVASLHGGLTKVHCLKFARDRHVAPEGGDPREGHGWLLAAGDAGGAVTVWDLGARVPQSYCLGSNYDVYAVDFSPDGATIASVGRNDVRLYDLATGRLLLTLEGGNFMHGLAFSPDGRRLAVGSSEAFGSPGSVWIWDLAEGRGLRTLRGLRGRVEKVAFSPDGRLVAGLSHDWQVGIWDRDSGHLRLVLDVPQGLVADNAALAFRGDGRRFAFASGRGAKLWDLEAGKVLGAWSVPDGLQDALAFVGDDRLMLLRIESKDDKEPPYGETDPRKNPRVCRLRDLLGEKPTEPVAVVTELNLHVQQIEASPDGLMFAVGGTGGTVEARVREIRAYEATTGRLIWSIPGHRHPYLRFDPTGKILVHWDSEDRVYQMIDAATRAPLGDAPSVGWPGPGARRWLDHLNSPGRSIEWAHGFAMVEGGRAGPLLHIFLDEAVTSQVPRFSPDGERILWGSAGGTVTIADLREIQRRLAGVGLGW